MSTQGSIDTDFLSDLVAANRLKSFLIARGIDVPDETLRGLADLSTEFREEIEEHNRQFPLRDNRKDA